MSCLLDHQWNVMLNYLIAFLSSDESDSQYCEHRGQKGKYFKFHTYEISVQMIVLKKWKKWGENINMITSFFFLCTFFVCLFISWRLITLQYCSGFCHTLTWISHGYTCIPHSDPPSHHPPHPITLGLPSAPGPSTCLMHPTWAGDLFHPRCYTCFDAVLLKHPTLAFSHRV